MALPQFYDAEVVKSGKFNENTIFLGLKIDGDFSFLAGQYLLVYIEVDGKEINRPYSIASNPSKKTIELLIRKYENGKVSPRLFDLKVGDNLKIRGPFGHFLVKKPLKEETIFIACGTGIAPLRSMIYEILENFRDKKIKLIYGFRHEEDFFFAEEFRSLLDENFELVVSATKPGENWKHLKGRLTEILPGVLEKGDKNIYICGPNQMINDTLNLLVREMGFDKEQIHYERWGS